MHHHGADEMQTLSSVDDAPQNQPVRVAQPDSLTTTNINKTKNAAAMVTMTGTTSSSTPSKRRRFEEQEPNDVHTNVERCNLQHDNIHNDDNDDNGNDSNGIVRQNAPNQFDIWAIATKKRPTLFLEFHLQTLRTFYHGHSMSHRRTSGNGDDNKNNKNNNNNNDDNEMQVHDDHDDDTAIQGDIWIMTESFLHERAALMERKKFVARCHGIQQEAFRCVSEGVLSSCSTSSLSSALAVSTTTASTATTGVMSPNPTSNIHFTASHSLTFQPSLSQFHSAVLSPGIWPSSSSKMVDHSCAITTSSAATTTKTTTNSFQIVARILQQRYQSECAHFECKVEPYRPLLQFVEVRLDRLQKKLHELQQWQFHFHQCHIHDLLSVIADNASSTSMSASASASASSSAMITTETTTKMQSLSNQHVTQLTQPTLERCRSRVVALESKIRLWSMLMDDLIAILHF